MKVTHDVEDCKITIDYVANLYGEDRELQMVFTYVPDYYDQSVTFKMSRECLNDVITIIQKGMK